MPEGGLENAIVRRIDSDAFKSRVTSYTDRAECVRAVATGSADACIVDKQFAMRLLSKDSRKLKWQSLPDDVWPDLWTVLIVPKQVVNEKREALAIAVNRLALDASAVLDRIARQIRYLDPLSSMAALQDGTLQSAFQRWGGEELPVSMLLLEARSKNLTAQISARKRT